MIASPSALILSSGGNGGGGGATPGGTPTELQFNAGSGTFGGAAGTSVDTAGNILIAPTGSAVAALTVTQFDDTSSALMLQDATDDRLSASVFDGVCEFVESDAFGDGFSFDVSLGSSSLEFADSFGGNIIFSTDSGISSLVMTDATSASLTISPSLVGFFSAMPVGQPIVTGVKLPSDTVMASLLSAIASLGLIIDSTT